MKNNDLNREFYLEIPNYNIKIERFLIELYYREIIDYLVEYSISKDSVYFNTNLEFVNLDEFLKDIDNYYEPYKNHLLNLIA